MKGQIVPVPAFFNPKNASNYFYGPNHNTLFGEAESFRKQHNINAPKTGEPNVHLLVIDPQKDFCFSEGSLYVGGRSGSGAIDDNVRLSRFIYENLNRLTNLTVTLDTHWAFQIFSPSFWIYPDGTHPKPFTEIVAKDVGMHNLRPNPAMVNHLIKDVNMPLTYPYLLRQAKYYCEVLEAGSKYKLYLWPVHCILGSDGHAVAGLVQEARMFFSYVRGVQSWAEVKGGNPLSENYSVLKPEVQTLFDGGTLGQINTKFIEKLLKSDVLILAGQAASHCVKSSIEDLLDEFSKVNTDLLKKVYIMTDCMSSVTVPDGKGGFFVDFTEATENAFKKFAAAGMNLVKSTDPIESWPGIKL